MNNNIPPHKKSKVVRLIARLNVGGPARHVVWLTQALQNERFESRLLTGVPPEGEEDMGYFAEAHGVEPVLIPEMSRELSGKDVVSLWKVWRYLRREKPDLIHTHTAKAGTIGRAAGFLYRWLTWKTLVGRPRPVKFVHTFHGHVFHSYYGKRKTQIFLFVEKMLARTATDRIIVISRQQFQEIHHDFGVGRTPQFQIVPLGIDLSPFERSGEKRPLLREEIGARDDEILVGLVGRLTEIKNHALFLEVARLYRERRATAAAAAEAAADSPRLRFVVIGGGHLRDELERAAESAGLLADGGTVEFLGNRNDADVFYAGLDVVALTSHNEGTPLSLIEAMGCARPVISTAVGGVVDLLGEREEEKDGFTVCERGLSVPAGDAEAFYNGLIYLAKSEKLRGELSRRGRDYVFSNYSKERLVREIENLYCDLLSEKG